MPKPTVNISGYILRETDKAIQIRIHQVNGAEVDEQDAWFPISQTESITKSAHPEDMDVIRVTEWIARTKELIE